VDRLAQYQQHKTPLVKVIFGLTMSFAKVKRLILQLVNIALRELPLALAKRKTAVYKFSVLLDHRQIRRLTCAISLIELWLLSVKTINAPFALELVAWKSWRTLPAASFTAVNVVC
jgi:hypothetical protein